MCTYDGTGNNVVQNKQLATCHKNVETSYFAQLKMCYLMTTFRCPSDILITS